MMRRLHLSRIYVRLICYLLPLLSFLISGIGSAISGRPVLEQDRAPLLLVVTLVWIAAAEYFRLTNIQQLFIERSGAIAATKTLISTYLLSFALMFLFAFAGTDTGFYARSAFVLMILALLMKAISRGIISSHPKLASPLRVLIVGTDSFAHASATRLINSPLGNCEIVGFVHIDGQAIAIDDYPILELEELDFADLIGMVDDVVIAVRTEQLAGLPNLIRMLEPLGVPIRAILDFGRDIVIRDRFFQFGGLQLLDLGLTPAESYSYMLLKRGFDIVFSLFVLTVMSPVFLFVAAAIKLTSPGTVLFSQERVGLSGKVFKMYKFRSMRPATKAESDLGWTIENDPRVTTIGRFLRGTSLDELPQFLNTLKGDMSVVGPRPERPHFVRQFGENLGKYNCRHHMKVGITGWAQVNGWRGNTSISKRLEYDLHYLQNWSFSFDLRIVLLTVLRIFKAENAY